MPDVNVKGRYRIYTHDGTEPLPFTSYATSLCSIRRPNPNTFITISQYIPGSLSPYTTFDPGSSYTIVSRSNVANFSIGSYARASRLPSSVTFKSPNFYHGLDKNSITVAISSYASSAGSPLSTVFTYIPDADGFSVNSVSFDTARYNQGLPSLLTHLTPNSSYQFKTRVPFTFFAPLQSEMGDAWATGANNYGQLGMGYEYSDVGYTQLYGNWDKVVTSITHAAALSTCGTKKKLFVCGGNAYGQLGLTPVVNGSLQPSITATQPVWREVQSIWTWDFNPETYYYTNILNTENILDVEVGDDFTLIKTDVQLYGCGRMSNMGMAAPGEQDNTDYQFTGARGKTFTDYHIPYFTSFLQRGAPIKFMYYNGSDLETYYTIPSNNVKKFQARGAHWFYLNTDGRLYGQGKLGASSTITSNHPIVMPVGVSDQRRASSQIIVPGYVSTTQLYGPGNPSTRYYDEFYDDFEANLACIAALSANFKTWLVHGPTNFSSNGTAAQKAGNPSLSSICLFDPNQNAYVPQNDYFLRVYPSWNGFMAIYNGKLYFTSNGAWLNQGYDAEGVYGAGTAIINRLPASTLPVLNNALGANPAEKANLRTLIPLTYMGQPDISWKSLFTTLTYSAAIDVNNKLYVTGLNSLISSGIDAKSLLGFPAATNNIYTFTQVNEENIYNANTNHANLVVYKTSRNPAPSPTPIPTFTPTPTPTLRVKFKTQGFLTGNLPQSITTSTQDTVRDGNDSSFGWSTNILFNEPAGRTDCNSQVYNNYSLILQYDYGANSTNPAQNVRYYRHYSNRTFESPQMEPASFGGRICNVFNGYSAGSTASKLCFQYFSQNLPRAEYCTDIQGNYVYYQQRIYSKMAPNSGTFLDNRNSTQRIEIDSSEIGNSAHTDFYINPANNSYHVFYNKKGNTNVASVYPYYFYYTNSYDRGSTWSTPKIVENGYYVTTGYGSQAGPWVGQLYCSRGMPNDHLVVVDTNRQNNTPKPAALFSCIIDGNNTSKYKVVCAYTVDTPLDASVVLATQTGFDTTNFHGDIGNLKLLTDQTNSLIAMYCGVDTPPSNATNSWQTGDGSDGGGIWGAPYTGVAPCRIYYRYCNLNSFNWSAQREIGKTFPRRGLFDYFPSSNPYGRGIIGRIWDACIDESDNTLCIVYTPTVDRNTVWQGKYSFCAWKLYVKKVNIYTNTTIFDELIYDITNHSTYSTSSSYFKTITVSNICYDTQRSSLVVCAHTAYDTTLGDGAGVTLQRAGTNSWTYIGNGPYSGLVLGSRKYKLVTQKYV